MSGDSWVAFPPGAMGLSVVSDCGISWSYSLFYVNYNSLNEERQIHVAF